MNKASAAILAGLILLIAVAAAIRNRSPEMTAQSTLSQSGNIPLAVEDSDSDSTIWSGVDEGPVIPGVSRIASGRDLSMVRKDSSDPNDAIKDLAKNFYTNADQVAFIKIDPEQFVANLKFSRAYMYAESGNYPAEVEAGQNRDLLLPLFGDQEYDLSITNVDIVKNGDSGTIIVRGQLVNEAQSVFRFTTTEEGTMLSGYIDTPTSYIRLDTWKISDHTAVAEFNRATVEKYSGPID